MPNLKERWHPRKKPTLQIRILKYIAIKGELSQKEATIVFRCKPSTISEAFKVLEKQRQLITKIKKFQDLSDSIKRRKFYKSKFYKLSNKGLLAFINGNPSPCEFWIALMWYCSLNSNVIDQTQFNIYYSMFIEKFLGDSFPLRSCFFLSDSFDRVLKRWEKSTIDSEDQRSTTNAYYEQHNPKHAYKVIECLSQNRAVTIEQITTLTQLSEQEIIKVLDDYSITQSRYHDFIDQYESAYQSDTSIDVTTDFLSHLIIIPLREEQRKVTEAQHKTKDQKYELSLLGILLIIGAISLTRQQSAERILHSTYKYYNKIASNYPDKLPLIFGKWNLLKKVLRFDFFPSIFDYLFLGKSEILSLSVLLGGNKEIYDNIKSAALSTINKYSIIYDRGTSAVESNDLPEGFAKSKHYHFIQKKLDEIQTLLRYSDLEYFAEHIKSKKKIVSGFIQLPPNVSIKNMPDLTFGELYAKYPADSQENPDYFEDDLKFIEKALADEFSLLFYIGLLRENNHKASDYPLTAGFLRSGHNSIYPKDFLLDVVRSDDKIGKKLIEWIREATIYQRLALDKMNQILDKTNKILQK